MFQKSHKFKNTLVVFVSKILLKSSKNLDFLLKMCVEEEPEYYKLALNILYMTNFVTPSFSVLKVAA